MEKSINSQMIPQDKVCFLCKNLISKPDFGFMFDGKQINFCHLICISYQQAMVRLETEEYLLKELAPSFERSADV